jgi:hypothetical protein
MAEQLVRMGRKFWLGVLFLVLSFALAETAVIQGVTGWDAAGVTALIAAMASGLLSVIRGNVDEHRAKSGPPS